MVALNVYHASNVSVDLYNSSCLVLQCHSAEVSRMVTSSFVWSWVISVNVNEGPKIPRIELNTVHLYQHYSLFMHNKLHYIWRGDYCKCVRPAQAPVLTWRSSSVPPGTTFTIRSPPGPRRLQQHNTHNRQTAMPPAEFEPEQASSRRPTP